jgi:hypothetical protein
VRQIEPLLAHLFDDAEGFCGVPVDNVCGKLVKDFTTGDTKYTSDRITG